MSRRIGQHRWGWWNLCSGATVQEDDHELDVLMKVIYIFAFWRLFFFRVFVKACTKLSFDDRWAYYLLWLRDCSAKGGDYWRLFVTIRDYSSLFATIRTVRTIRYSLLFAVRYSLFATIRYSLFGFSRHPYLSKPLTDSFNNTQGKIRKFICHFCGWWLSFVPCFALSQSTLFKPMRVRVI